MTGRDLAYIQGMRDGHQIGLDHMLWRMAVGAAWATAFYDIAAAKQFYPRDADAMDDRADAAMRMILICVRTLADRGDKTAQGMLG